MSNDARVRRESADRLALAQVAAGPGLKRRSDTVAVDVCSAALRDLAGLRDELNRIGAVVQDWPGGLPAVVAESLKVAAEGVGGAYRGVAAADAAIRSAEFGR